MGALDDLEEVKKDLEELKQESFAMEILSDIKQDNAKLETTNKRLFGIWIITFIAFIGLLGYTLYLLNDIGVEETTISQENQGGYNNYIGNDGEITNGKTND